MRHGYRPVIIVLDNKGYGTERFLHPGDYNDIHPWKYHKLTEVFGGGTGYEVRTEGEFDRALVAGLERSQRHEPDPGSPGRRRLQHGSAPPGRAVEQAGVKKLKIATPSPGREAGDFLTSHAPRTTNCRRTQLRENPWVTIPGSMTRLWS